MAVASFVGNFWLNVPFPLLILGATAVALLARRFFPAPAAPLLAAGFRAALDQLGQGKTGGMHRKL